MPDAVYDDEDTDKPLVNSNQAEEDKLRQSLGDSYAGAGDSKRLRQDSKDDEGGSTDESTGKRRGLRQKDEEADRQESRALKDSVGGLYKQSRDDDQKAGSGGKNSLWAKKGPNSKRNKLLAGGILGAISLLVGSLAFFGSFFWFVQT